MLLLYCPAQVTYMHTFSHACNCTQSVTHITGGDTEATINPIQPTRIMPQRLAQRVLALTCQVLCGNFLRKALAVKASPALCQSLYSATFSAHQQVSVRGRTLMRLPEVENRGEELRFKENHWVYFSMPFQVLCQMKVYMPAAAAAAPCQSRPTSSHACLSIPGHG